MEKFIEAFRDLITKSAGQVQTFASEHGPQVTFALGVVFIGWVTAVVVKKLIAKLLKALGFDVLAEKTGLKAFLDRGEIKKKPSALVGLLFYWIIFLNALVMAADILNPKVTFQFLHGALVYGPKIFVVIIFAVLALTLARFAYNAVEKTARAAGLPLHRVLGAASYYATLGVVAMICLQYLGVNMTTVTHIFIIIFIVVPVGFFIALLIGGRNMLACVFSKKYIEREYRIGDTISFDSVTGSIESIESIVTRIRSADDTVIVPNAELAKKIIRKKNTNGR